MIAQLAVALFLLFHLLRDRQRLLASVRALLPLSRAEADRVLQRPGEAVFANFGRRFGRLVEDSFGRLESFEWCGRAAPAESAP